MIITLDDYINSLVRQKDMAQREEEAGGRRKAGPTGTPAPCADAPIGPTRSRVSNARNRRRHGWWRGARNVRKRRKHER